jgi:sigma54-dependent transcription regulator
VARYHLRAGNACQRGNRADAADEQARLPLQLARQHDQREARQAEGHDNEGGPLENLAATRVGKTNAENAEQYRQHLARLAIRWTDLRDETRRC